MDKKTKIQTDIQWLWAATVEKISISFKWHLQVLKKGMKDLTQ